MGGCVIVTRLDSSYKWKIKSLKHVRGSFQASAAETETAISIEIAAKEIRQIEVLLLWVGYMKNNM